MVGTFGAAELAVVALVALMGGLASPSFVVKILFLVFGLSLR